MATLGGSSEGAVSTQYGGVGGITAAADPVYQAIGQARSPACSTEHSMYTRYSPAWIEHARARRLAEIKLRDVLASPTTPASSGLRLSCATALVPRAFAFALCQADCPVRGADAVPDVQQVVTLSGRTIRDEAQASPLLAQLAIERIDTLLAVVCPPAFNPLPVQHQAWYGIHTSAGGGCSQLTLR